MTIREAIRQGIKHIRLPQWEPTAHIELPLLPGGLCGPWATVRDVSGEQQVLLPVLLSDVSPFYEEWTGTPQESDSGRGPEKVALDIIAEGK